MRGARLREGRSSCSRRCSSSTRSRSGPKPLFLFKLFVLVRILVGLPQRPCYVPAEHCRKTPWFLRWRYASTCFDSTLGFPGEGPSGRKQRLPLQDRPDVELAEERVDATEQTRREVALAAFEIYLQEHLGFPVAVLVTLEGRIVSRHLAEYGQHLYKRGAAVGTYVSAILAVVDKERSLRKMLTAAWDVAESWRMLMLWANHIPTPPALALALFSLAVCWGWHDMAVFNLLCFTGMMRPSECLKLTRADVLLPSDLLSFRRVVYVRVRDPKNKRIAARREHVKVEDRMIVDLLSAWLPRLPPDVRLFQFSASRMRVYHDHLVAFFGVPCRDGEGITPASHRGGGAILCFERSGSLDLTRWRGRWSATSRTLEIYIQEVAAASVLPSLDANHRERIRLFAAAATSLWNDLVRQVLSA